MTEVVQGDLAAALRRAEERFDKVFRRSPVALVLSTATGEILDVNEAFERVHEIPRDAAIGRSAVALGILAADVRARLEAVVAEEGRLRGVEVPFRRRGADGYVSLWVERIELDGRPCVLTALLDVSDRVAAERELARANEDLAAALRAAREAIDALARAQAELVQREKLAGLGALVAGVAHEVNNPLSFVNNNLAVLQRDFESLAGAVGVLREAEALLARERPDLAARLRAIDAESDLAHVLAATPTVLARTREGVGRIQRIVADLRTFARLDEDVFAPTDLNEAVVSTTNILRGEARAAGVELALDLGALGPVWCNGARVNQVVMNLVSNAIHACAPGGAVTVRTRSEGRGARIEVEDDGRGIAPEVLPRIFEPFFTTKPVGGGAGLGLSISYAIARAHGGRITVASTPGAGSCFTVFLPGEPG